MSKKTWDKIGRDIERVIAEEREARKLVASTTLAGREDIEKLLSEIPVRYDLPRPSILGPITGGSSIPQPTEPDKLDLILAELKDMNRSLKRLAWRRN